MGHISESSELPVQNRSINTAGPKNRSHMNSKRLFPLAVLALALVALSPAAYASSINITLNPSTNTADINASSTTHLILTYPANSMLSHQLNGTDTSETLSGSFHSDSDATNAIQASIDHTDPNLRVVSANFTYSLSAKGNTTAFVLTKQTNITAVVTGVFTVVNGTVHANLGWKDFALRGQLLLNLQSRTVDVNEVGSAFSMQLGGRPIVLNALLGMFGGNGLWQASTIDYSSLNSPLSTWTSHYDSSTNTTTYSKTINTNSSLNSTYTVNGQTYTLSEVSDPSAQIAVQGYAVASGDSLTIQPAPASIGLAGVDPMVWVAAGVVTIVVLGSAFYMFRRSRARTPSTWLSNVQSSI